MKHHTTALEDLNRIKVEDLKALPIVVIYFIDHASSSTDTIPIEVYGRLLHQDTSKTIVISWLPDMTDPSDVRRNWEVFALSTPSIVSIRKLVPGAKIKVKK